MLHIAGLHIHNKQNNSLSGILILLLYMSLALAGLVCFQGTLSDDLICRKPSQVLAAVSCAATLQRRIWSKIGLGYCLLP